MTDKIVEFKPRDTDTQSLLQEVKETCPDEVVVLATKGQNFTIYASGSTNKFERTGMLLHMLFQDVLTTFGSEEQ